MGWKSLVGVAFAFFSAVPAIAQDAAGSVKPRPNVLFIAVDDLRPELGCYGNTVIKSPNIDRIAAKGLVFNRAYVQQAVCSPSRSSLLTGTRPDTTKVWDLETHFRTALPNVTTLPEHFKNNGYFVQGFGKIYHGGFDDPQSWSVPWQTAKTQGYALAENREIAAKKRQAAIAAGKTGKAANRSARGPAYEAADVPDDTFIDGKVAGLAVDALKDISGKKQPFFLAVGFARPHLPFVAPKKYWDWYDGNKIPAAENPFQAENSPPFALTPGSEISGYDGVGKLPVPSDTARALKHGYYASVSYMDAQVGRVLDELHRLNLDDNTIVILWGDHGWKLGEHGGWAKQTNFENDTRSTLLISVPGQKSAGQKTNAIVEFVDIYPTLADLAGLKLPSHLQGQSAKNVIDNPSLPGKAAAFSQYPRQFEGQPLMGYTIRTDRYRLTQWFDRRDHTKLKATELYDHSQDPQENKNVADRPENADVVKTLAAQLTATAQTAAAQ